MQYRIAPRQKMFIYHPSGVNFEPLLLKPLILNEIHDRLGWSGVWRIYIYEFFSWLFTILYIWKYVSQDYGRVRGIVKQVLISLSITCLWTWIKSTHFYCKDIHIVVKVCIIYVKRVGSLAVFRNIIDSQRKQKNKPKEKKLKRKKHQKFYTREKKKWL